MKKLFFALPLIAAVYAFSVPASAQTDPTAALDKALRTQIRQEEPLVVAYFTASWCPPCRQFKKEYLNRFAETYMERYGGRIRLVEFDISDKKSKNFEAFAATCAAYGEKNSGIPLAVIGDTFLPGPDPEPFEAAIDKALANHEKTRLFFTPQTDSKPETLYDAVLTGDLQSAREFLQNGANPNEPDPYGASLLMLAAFYGRTDIARLLIRHNADVNFKSPFGYTAALNAAFTGQQEILRLLERNGADLWVETPGGENLLGAAAKGLQSDILDILIRDYGFDVNRRLQTGSTVLIWAVDKRNDPDAAEVLLRAGADPSASYEGKTPLGYAHTETMRALLRRYGAE